MGQLWAVAERVRSLVTDTVVNELLTACGVVEGLSCPGPSCAEECVLFRLGVERGPGVFLGACPHRGGECNLVTDRGADPVRQRRARGGCLGAGVLGESCSVSVS